MSERLTISRADLVDIATEAMKGSGITREQHIEMCETAHTMEKVLLGAWVGVDCGCLVGTAYRNELVQSDNSFSVHDRVEGFLQANPPMSRVGVRFDELLRERFDRPHGRIHVTD